MKEKLNAVDRAISEAARKAALALTPEQRKANGKRSWKTRRENLAKELGGK